MDSDVRACMYKGKKNRMKVLYFSQKRFDEKIRSYCRKAERDWEEAMERREKARKGKSCKGSKRNVFMKARVGYVFPLDLDDREGSIKRAVEQMTTGREGCFVLTCTKIMLPKVMLQKYRERNRIEDAYRDLKHGVDIRPLRCRDDDSIRGRVLIAYLALTALAFARFVAPEISSCTAETIVGELSSFSLTEEVSDGRVVRAVYSNFNATVRAIIRGFERISAVAQQVPARGKARTGG